MRPMQDPEVIVIENCESQFAFVCPRLWDSLMPGADVGVRHCFECNRDVHRADTVEEGRSLAAEGKCVALRRRPDRPWDGYVVGMIATPFDKE